MRGLVALLVVLASTSGCKFVYDAQYNDRADELEENRVEVPVDGQLLGYATTANRLYFVDTPEPLEQTTLHSFDPSDSTGASRIDYTLPFVPSDQQSLDRDFHFGDHLIVNCGSQLQAFDSRENNPTMVTTDSFGDRQACSIVGDKVYFIGLDPGTGSGDGSGGIGLDVWEPLQQSTPRQLISFEQKGIDTDSIQEFVAADDSHMIYNANSKLYFLDPTSDEGVWTMNEDSNSPFGVDDSGVVFETVTSQQSLDSDLTYISFNDDFAPFSVQELIDDGGYHMSSSHDDVQNLNNTTDFDFSDHHLIYRAKHGIFSLGLHTGNVSDVLLDRGIDETSGPTLRYSGVRVTKNGFAFVLGSPAFSSTGTLYQVDLNGLLP